MVPLLTVGDAGRLARLVTESDWVEIGRDGLDLIVHSPCDPLERHTVRCGPPAADPRFPRFARVDSAAGCAFTLGISGIVGRRLCVRTFLTGLP